MSKFEKKFINLNELEECALSGVYTHTGKFHADDVFTYALLKLSNVVALDEQLHMVSVLPAKASSALSFNLGEGEFNSGIKFRKDLSKYSSFGLLWDYIGEEFLKENFNISDEYDSIIKDAFKHIDDEFVRNIDSIDNANSIKALNPLSYWAKSYNANDTSKTDLQLSAFIKASNVAVEMLKNIVTKNLEDAVRRYEYSTILNAVDPEVIINKSSSRITMKDVCDVSESVKAMILPSPQGYNLCVRLGSKLPSKVKKMDGYINTHPNKLVAFFKTLDNAVDAVKSFVKGNIITIDDSVLESAKTNIKVM